MIVHKLYDTHHCLRLPALAGELLLEISYDTDKGVDYWRKVFQLLPSWHVLSFFMECLAIYNVFNCMPLG